MNMMNRVADRALVHGLSISRELNEFVVSGAMLGAGVGRCASGVGSTLELDNSICDHKV